MSVQQNGSKWWVIGAAVSAGVLVTLAALPHARGEVVYETGVEEIPTGSQSLGTATTQPSTMEGIRTDDRAALRDEVKRSKNIRLNNQEMNASYAEAPMEAEVIKPAKSEVIRKNRVQTELKTEDRIQERLEEMRLRDEERRSQQIMSSMPAGSGEQLRGEERMGSAQPAPAPAKDHVVVSQSAPTSVAEAPIAEESKTYKTQFSITPRLGMTQIRTDNDSVYDVRPRYSAGIALGVSASEYIGMELGYTHNEMGVAFKNNYQYQNTLVPTDTYTMTQNMVDLSLKASLLGRDSMVRPFLGAGAGYARTSLNYDQRLLSVYGNGINRAEYSVDQFLGSISAGLDVQVTKSISLGMMFRYHSVLSASENSTFSPYYYYAAPNQPTSDKVATGGSLARESFYTIAGGLTFTF